MAGATGTGVQGIDPAGVAAWFAAHVPDARGGPAFDLITGGRSNLTYLVTDEAGARWVLRRPPTGAIGRGAHDVAREWSVLEALAGSPVPVPVVVGHCTDPEVTGADFYVMDHVDGAVLDDAAAAGTVPPDRRVALSEDIVDTLVKIHAVDCRTGPLSARYRPSGHLERQMRTWAAQLDAAGIDGGPLRQVERELVAGLPAQRWTGIVHGDYRPGNLIVGPEGRVRAVLDWELWTVGDVLVDVGWLIAMWRDAEVIGWAPEPAHGFLPADAAAARYAAGTGRDLTDLRFYEAFALWRLAVIAEGVADRFRRGAMGDQDVDLDVLSARPLWLAERAAETLIRG